MNTPRYIKNANKILDVLEDQPNRVWDKTQRELSAELKLSQPELSNLLKLLCQERRIKRGSPLPGVRGRNFTIELIDSTHLSKNKKKNHTNGSLNLQAMSLEQVEDVIMGTIKQGDEKNEYGPQQQRAYLKKIRELRDQLGEERRFRLRVLSEKEALERMLAAKDEEISDIRAKLNAAIIQQNSKTNNKIYSKGFKLYEILSDDERQVLRNLTQSSLESLG